MNIATRYSTLTLFLALLSFAAADCFAQYKITLSNGRELIAHDYREEGSWIRVTFPRGEVALRKVAVDKIETIPNVTNAVPSKAADALSIDKRDRDELHQRISELDARIHEAQQALKQAQREGAAAGEIRQRAVRWNRLRLERIELTRHPDVGGGKEVTKRQTTE